jgi:predicted kinase
MIDDRSCDIRDLPVISSGNQLILMVGLPRSGKSSWANQQGIPIVDLDAIRLAKTGQRWWGPIEHEISATARTMVRALFVAGHKTVILDSCNLLYEQREYFKCSPDIVWDRLAKIIDTPASVCKDRAATTYPDLVPVIDWFDTNKQAIAESEQIKILA